MTLTINQLLAMERPLNELAQSKLPFKTARKISKFIKELATEMEMIYKERDRIVDTYYKERDERGMPIGKLSAEEERKFNHDFRTFIETEIDGLTVPKLPIDSFDNLEFTPFEVQVLSVLFEDEDDEVAKEVLVPTDYN